MPAVNILVTGVSGYIFLAALAAQRRRTRCKSVVFCLLRDAALAPQVITAGGVPVIGSLDAGVALAGVIVDRGSRGESFSSGTGWPHATTSDAADVEALQRAAPHCLFRNTESNVLESARMSDITPWIVVAPLVHGLGRGVGNQASSCISRLVRAALRHGRAMYVLPGDEAWATVHVDTLAEYLLAVLLLSMSPPHSSSPSSNSSPYPTPPSSTAGDTPGGYVFATTSHVSWRDLAAVLGSCLHARGLIPDPDPAPFPSIAAAARALDVPRDAVLRQFSGSVSLSSERIAIALPLDTALRTRGVEGPTDAAIGQVVDSPHLSDRTTPPLDAATPPPLTENTGSAVGTGATSQLRQSVERSPRGAATWHHPYLRKVKTKRDLQKSSKAPMAQVVNARVSYSL
ncbi:hypothetical protein Q8F55_007376 [Vanrija albida]|uniref:Thioester reductase (TE) domain-containing protein n=1 Tax=Vanrija albida TaxID=181172 RepID=A0ABR3PTM2_9TREE